MLLTIQTGCVVQDLGIEKGYKLFKDLGFEAIDWNIDTAWDVARLRKGDLSGCIFEKPLEEIMDYYRDELAEIRKNGLVISQAHAPFPAYIQDVPGFLDYAIEIYKGCIRLCDAVGCKNLVIHGISPSPDHPELTPAKIEELNMRLYSSLIPVLKETQVTVCLENLFSAIRGFCYEGYCSNPFEACKAVDTLNEMAGKTCFGLCLDTGHLNLLHKNMTHYIRTVGKRLRCLHVHDNDGNGDEHLMPFVGNIRWNDFLAALKEIGYDGDLSFETFAQVVSGRMDPEFIPVFLKAIADTGRIFIQRLNG